MKKILAKTIFLVAAYLSLVPAALAVTIPVQFARFQTVLSGNIVSAQNTIVNYPRYGNNSATTVPTSGMAATQSSTSGLVSNVRISNPNNVPTGATPNGLVSSSGRIDIYASGVVGRTLLNYSPTPDNWMNGVQTFTNSGSKFGSMFRLFVAQDTSINVFINPYFTTTPAFLGANVALGQVGFSYAKYGTSFTNSTGSGLNGGLGVATSLFFNSNGQTSVTAAISKTLNLKGGSSYLFYFGGQLLNGNLSSATAFDVLFGFSPSSGYTLSTNNVAVVPLPAALPLFGSAIASFGFMGWLRRKKKSSLKNGSIQLDAF